MAGLIDTIYTFRFIKILSTKWTDMDAYKFGIIDENGNALKKSAELMLNKEKSAYTPFHRLIFKLKRLMEKVPGGKSAVARYGAALLLIKEHKQEVESMGIDLKSLEEGLKKYIDGDILEEEVTNSTGGIEGKEQPLGKKGEVNKRKKKKEDDVVDKNNTSEEKSTCECYDEDLEEVNYSYQVIGGALIRVDEAGQSRKRVIKKRIVGGKRQKKREFKSGEGSRFTRTGNRKLKGGALAKKRRSLRKAKRKSQTGSAKAKRKRSMKKSRRYN